LPRTSSEHRLMKRCVHPRQRNATRPSLLRTRSIPDSKNEGRTSVEPQPGHFPERSIGSRNHACTGSLHKRKLKKQNTSASAKTQNSMRLGLQWIVDHTAIAGVRGYICRKVMRGPGLVAARPLSLEFRHVGQESASPSIILSRIARDAPVRWPAPVPLRNCVLSYRLANA